jgi:hypothetical protein
MGTVISMPISGLLCQYLGWESVFYVFGMEFCVDYSTDTIVPCNVSSPYLSHSLCEVSSCSIGSCLPVTHNV